ncbi:YitT family protein [Cytobacillus firmus]|uniref:YitT family protein n=1 Tax=Cytobacillus firmus TaxID=1399 RepID=UPI00077C64AF|nr:YitT family protein [Cytobacillus firmus]MBG9542329.1 membrane protein [Cytobacillus firmus]MBG9548671.1 membrane protein [Cytobacillus firmus]MBG9553612.1 membrane protein [Cytobacillus firmus]MBG9557720.1 membrane protein [Cytobacillus firmus]MBG9573930.1 membrane protein [Cytobacillus firmus]
MGKNRRGYTYSTKAERLLEYLYVLIGSGIVAVAFNVFLLPNRIASGGVSGISTILDAVVGWEPAYVQWAFNIPLFIAGVLLLGKQFGAKTLAGTIFLPFVVFLTKEYEPWTSDPLLASLFGGIGVGLGLGIVFRGKASTGGTDLAAQIINKYTGLSLGTCVAIIDGLIVLSAAIIFDIEQGLYALIALYVTSKTIDLIQLGFSRTKMALIITENQSEVREGILNKIDRGVTKLSAYGGYTDHERPVLMCVVDQTEFTKLKQLVQTIDPTAFIIVTDASEVLGEGFKRA